MKIQLFKQEVIDALHDAHRKNKLISHAWITTMGIESIDAPECKACAVGTVLASCFEPRTNPEIVSAAVNHSLLADYSSSLAGYTPPFVDKRELGKILQKHDYIRALSYVYEGTVAGSYVDEEGISLSYRESYRDRIALAVEACIDLVKENFPDYITVEIGNKTAFLKPGVKVCND